MRKRHSPNFKAETVIAVLKEDQTINQIASDKKIHPTQIYDWKAHALKELPTLFEPQGKRDAELRADYEKRIHELYAEIGKLTTQLEWLKKKSGIESLPE
jgi:transposase